MYGLRGLGDCAINDLACLQAAVRHRLVKSISAGVCRAGDTVCFGTTAAIVWLRTPTPALHPRPLHSAGLVALELRAAGQPPHSELGGRHWRRGSSPRFRRSQRRQMTLGVSHASA